MVINNNQTENTKCLPVKMPHKPNTIKNQQWQHGRVQRRTLVLLIFSIVLLYFVSNITSTPEPQDVEVPSDSKGK